jgi:hypothetical protein
VVHVELAVAVADLIQPLGREPVRQLLLQRRPQPGDGQLRVDEDAGIGGECLVGGLDAGAGVDERHVEVEANRQSGHANYCACQHPVHLGSPYLT